MKRISSIVLITALLITSFVSLFAVAVNAAYETDPGTVVYKYSNTISSYKYADDATAIAWGAIAKFTNLGTNEVNYLKNWSSIAVFGGNTNTSTYACQDIQLIADDSRIVTLTDNMDGNCNSRKFTVDGGVYDDDGNLIDRITLISPSRFYLYGDDTAQIVLKNTKIANAGTDVVSAALQLGETKSKTGPRVILDNTDVVAGTTIYGTLMCANSDIVLQNGSRILNTGTVNSSYACRGVHLMGTAPSVTVIDGDIQSSGDAIYAAVKASIDVSGGMLSSASGVAIYNTKQGLLTISGGSFRSGYTGTDMATVHHVGTDGGGYISGAEITASNGARALYIRGGTVERIDKCTVNGGVYIYGEADVTNCNITANGNMPALNVASKTVSVENCNISAENASAVYLTENSSYPSCATLTEVNAVSSGAEALYAEANSDFYIKSGSFIGNGTTAATYVTAADGISDDAYALTLEADTLSELLDSADLLEGASVRAVKNSSGIRFQSKITDDVYNDLINTYGKANVKFGTLIAPLDHIDGVLSKEALGEGRYLDIPCVDGFNDCEGYYVINAAMTNIRDYNYDREFAAAPYIIIITENGSVTAYGAWNETDNARSVSEVAYMALSDVLYVGQVIDGVEVTEEYIAQKPTYINTVDAWYEYDDAKGWVWIYGKGTAYTEYSRRQRDIIDDYLI